MMVVYHVFFRIFNIRLIHFILLKQDIYHIYTIVVSLPVIISQRNCIELNYKVAS